MAENNISAEYIPDENSCFGSCHHEDTRNNRSLVPDSDRDSSNIEVSLVGLSDISSDYTDSGDKQDDNGPKTIYDITVTANETFLT